MKPKIGLKTSDIFYNGDDKIEFDVMEITTKDRALDFNVKKIMKAMDYLKGKKLSLHSQTSRIFSCKNYGFSDFNDAELNVLRAEIILCKIMKVKELIFHLKQERLTKKEFEILEEIISFGKDNGVELIYESNGRFIANTCLDVLKKIPYLNYNLDLGHLNTSIGNKTLGMDLDEFVDKVKGRTVYLHAHNNDGKEDTHQALDNGTLDWKHVLDMLDMEKARKIIIECRTPEDVLVTKNLLEEYIENRK